MPTPRRNETQRDFIGRCIPIVRNEGRPADQSTAICYSIWRDHQRKKRGDDFLTSSFDSEEFITTNGWHIPVKFSAEDMILTDIPIVDVFENYEGFNAFEELQERDPTHVQTLIMSKQRFSSRTSAKSWAKSHGFKSNTIRETTNSWRLRQRLPEDFKQTSFRTARLSEGVQAVVGHLK